MKKIYIFLLFISLVYAFWLQLFDNHDTNFNYFYNILGSLNFLASALTSFYFFRKHPQDRLVYLSLGLGSLFYIIAQSIWYYYNTIAISNVPYPSLADLFFLGYYLSMIISGIIAMRKIQIHFSFGTIFEIVFVAAVILLITYSFIASISVPVEASFLAKFFNYAYPALDALLISMTLAAIRSRIGRLKPMLLFFMGSFITLTFGDALFAYQNSLNLYWNGNIVDIFFTFTAFFMAMAVSSMPHLLDSQNNKIS